MGHSYFVSRSLRLMRKTMKSKHFLRWIVLISLIAPLLLLLSGFVLPPVYEDTFLGELKYKVQRLVQVSGKKIVIVGGSSAAFGIDTPLMQQELPDYQVVNIGMYAALGTTIMLDLCRDSISEGDIVILCPELQEQTLSCYFGAEAFWQSSDGCFSLLTHLPKAHWGKAASAFGEFAGQKLRCFLTGETLEPGEIYRKSSFNEYGDIVNPECCQNILPDGYDPNMPVSFETALISPEFVTAVNAFTAQAQVKGAAVWFHLCPVNRKAVKKEAGSVPEISVENNTDAGQEPDREAEEQEVRKEYEDQEEWEVWKEYGDQEEQEEQIDAFFHFVRETLKTPIAGNPHDCLMDPGWFYDTNFHLNLSGKQVFTRTLIRDIKAMLLDASPTDIELPAMPEQKYPELEYSTEEPEIWDIDPGEPEYDLKLTKEEPNPWEDNPDLSEGNPEPLPDTTGASAPATGRLTRDQYAGQTEIETITIDSGVTWIEDGAFSGCTSLKQIYLPHRKPSSLIVGPGLLDGTDAVLIVPEGTLSAYRTDYRFSLFADRIQEE